MADITQILYTLLIIFGGWYILLIILYTIGWYRLKPNYVKEKNVSGFVSIIIPARNEEKNITKLLSDLIKQNFPNKQYEIIVTDDNSTDKTTKVVEEFIADNNQVKIKLIRLNEENQHGAYKKMAISKAVEMAKGELIVTTDADCRVGKNWLISLVSFYEKHHPKIIVGPVSFHNEHSLFDKMQSLEFLSLIAVTAGAIKTGRPIMCNGANLAYEKNAFIEVGGFGNDNFSSGDDVFLLLNIRKKFGADSIRFLKDYNSFVFTEAKKSIGEFIDQRTRWASKNKGYEMKILFVSFTVFMVNVLLATGLILSAFGIPVLKFVLMAIIVKFIIDFPILIGVSKFAKKSKILLYYLPLTLIYPFYIVLTGTLGVLGNFHWKGRKLKK